MKATDFIKRLEQLMEVAGDVEVVLYIPKEDDYESAFLEIVNVTPCPSRTVSTYKSLDKDNTTQVISVW